MDWVKLWTQTFRDPKIAGLPTNAQLVFVASIAYCGDTESDGFVPKAVVGLMCSVKVTPKLAALLIDAGLWEAVEGGWRIVGYLNRQFSHEEMEGRREKQKKGGARGAHERFHVKGGKPSEDCEFCQADGLCDRSTHSPPNGLSIAEERRLEKNSSSSSSDQRAAVDKPEDDDFEAVLHALAVAKSKQTAEIKGPGWFTVTERRDRRERGAEIRQLIAGYPTAPQSMLIAALLGQPSPYLAHHRISEPIAL